MRVALSSLILLCLQGGGLHAQGTFDRYISQLGQYVRQGTLAYHVTSVYPDGNKIETSGRMAVMGACTYDSSGLHLSIKNERYEVVADHEARSVHFLDLGNKSASASAPVRYMLDANYIKENCRVEKSSETETELTLKVRFKSADLIDNLLIRFSKRTMSPLSYSYTMNYPVDEGINEQGQVQKVTIRMQVVVTDISSDVSKRLFNPFRIVSVNNKQVKLIRYTDYILYKAN